MAHHTSAPINIYRHHCNIDSNVIMKVTLGHVMRRTR